jgi:hypothetical protein
MLTEKQMKSLPKGVYRNEDINSKFRGHCLPRGFKYPESFSYFSKKEKGYITGLKNRQQRRKGIKS